MAIHVQSVGYVSKDRDGSDCYIYITDNDDDLNIDQIHDHILPLAQDVVTPGVTYVNNLRIFPDTLPNTFVCVVELRKHN